MGTCIPVANLRPFSRFSLAPPRFSSCAIVFLLKKLIHGHNVVDGDGVGAGVVVGADVACGVDTTDGVGSAVGLSVRADVTCDDGADVAVGCVGVGVRCGVGESVAFVSQQTDPQQ